ncbi:MAG: hypothetical protein ACRCXX_08895 [Cetobacterium sp.]|uniref:hypothetical protein n=1 Tax=Cetobacterium sp. TaxID=2071632 RepID=UPI003F379561
MYKIILCNLLRIEKSSKGWSMKSRVFKGNDLSSTQVNSIINSCKKLNATIDCTLNGECIEVDLKNGSYRAEVWLPTDLVLASKILHILGRDRILPNFKDVIKRKGLFR